MPDLAVVTLDLSGLGADAAATRLRSSGADVAVVRGAPSALRWRSKRAALARESGLLVGTADRAGGLVVLVSMRTWVVAHDHALFPGSRSDAAVSAVVALDGRRWNVVGAAVAPPPGVLDRLRVPDVPLVLCVGDDVSFPGTGS